MPNLEWVILLGKMKEGSLSFSKSNKGNCFWNLKGQMVTYNLSKCKNIFVQFRFIEDKWYSQQLGTSVPITPNIT